MEAWGWGRKTISTGGVESQRTSTGRTWGDVRVCGWCQMDSQCGAGDSI